MTKMVPADDETQEMADKLFDIAVTGPAGQAIVALAGALASVCLHTQDPTSAMSTALDVLQNTMAAHEKTPRQTVN